MAVVIHRSRLADQAYELLKERILSRELMPGHRLSVPAIADELGLSRSPVREAVQRLVRDGLGSERPHSGAVVAHADLPALIDLYQVRAELEGLSCGLAAASGDDELVADLEVVHQRHEEAHVGGRRAEMIRVDVDFHARVLQSAGNPELTKMLEPVLHRMLLGMLEAEPDWPAQAVAEHREIIRALRLRDAEAARRQMVAHVLRVRSDLQRKLDRDRARGTVDTGQEIS